MPLYNRIYNINWNRFSVQNLPSDLRQLKTVQFMIAVIGVVKEMYSEFLALRERLLYEAKIDGRTCKLRRALNDEFDPIDRRIYITKGASFHPTTLYYDWKNKPVYLYHQGDARNSIIYYQSNVGNIVSVNFYVHVPTEIFFDKSRIIALVNKYYNISRTFEIIII